MTELDKAAIAAMRRSYGEVGLTASQISLDPVIQFHGWLREAAANVVIVEANAMVLSTVADGKPSSRTVLLKELSAAGFSFFTNYNSRKGQQIAANPAVSLLFPWYAMERQVIVLGHASKISEADSDAYFGSRPWSSQIGAWASAQSEALEDRSELEARYQEYADKYPEGSSVPRPPHWGGYMVIPTSIEFWQGRYSRLHDRIRYEFTTNGWKVQRFYP